MAINKAVIGKIGWRKTLPRIFNYKLPDLASKWARASQINLEISNKWSQWNNYNMDSQNFYYNQTIN